MGLILGVKKLLIWYSGTGIKSYTGTGPALSVRSLWVNKKGEHIMCPPSNKIIIYY